MVKATFLLALLLLAPGADRPARGREVKPARLDAIRPQIEALIRASGAEAVGVAARDLKTGEELLLNEHVSFHAASTMKVPVMMELFRRAAAGKLRLDDTVILRNEFRSIADGSPYRLDEKADGDPELYGRVGTPVSYRELIRRMITRSSNLATNVLIERAGAAGVMELMKELGANNIRVLRGVEDGRAFRQGLNNTTTAYDLLVLLRAIAEQEIASPAACEEMIQILLAQEFNSGIPAGLPPGVKVAHKTGAITRIRHDAAVVYPPGRDPYVLVVLTRGITDEQQSDRLIADISRAVYRALAAGGAAPTRAVRAP